MSAIHGNATTAAWNGQALGQVTAIGDVNITADTVETSIYNAADFFKKHIRGLLDAGEIPITCNFDATDAGQAAFATDFYAGTERNLTLTFPASTGTVWTLPCIPIGLGTAQPMDDKISITLTVKPNGKPTLATAASTGMSALSISNSAVLYPTFAIGTFDYVATVLTGVSSLTFTPTAANHTITLTANGASQTITSGQASSGVALGAAGSRTEVVIVVQESGKSPKTYTIDVARA